MGWLIYSQANSPQTPEAEKAEIERILTWEGADNTGRCIKAVKVGTVWYCAVRALSDNPAFNAPYVTAQDGSITFAAILLTTRNNGEWGYKDMTEACGPCEAECPASVLALLSPIDPENASNGAQYAREWRSRCTANHSTARSAAATWRNLRDGQRIRLPSPVRLTTGLEVQELVATTITRRGRKLRVFRIDGGGLCRLGQKDIAGFTPLG